MEGRRAGWWAEDVCLERDKMETPELETKRELNELNEELERQRGTINKLLGQGELKSQFIYHISNDLKIPLTNIIGFSKLLYLGEFGPLNADQQSHISSIIEESNRLMEIITQIRDAVQLDSNKMKLELTEVDMRNIGENSSIKMLAEVARIKGLKFSWQVQSDTPSVIADSGMIIRMFVNLIGNSIKFTESGSITVNIGNRMTKAGKRHSIECSIIDTGVGIPEEGRHRLFREFYGASKMKGNVKQDGSGIGLGLSLTKKMVELHGGKMGYEPREGGGSRFWFTIPIRRLKERSVN